VHVQSLITLASSATLLLLGLYVLVSSRALPNVLFSLASFCLAAVQFGIFMLQRSTSPSPWLHVALAGTCLAPTLWTAFSLVFARRNYKEWLSKWKLPLSAMGVTSLAFLLVPTSLLISGTSRSDGGWAIYLGPAGVYLCAFAIVSMVLVLFNLEATFKEGKRRLKLTTFASVGAAVIYLYAGGKALLFRYVEMSSLEGCSVAMFCASLLAGYAIVRYNLLESTVAVSRQVVYSSLTFLLAGAFLLTMGVFGGFIYGFGGHYGRVFASAVMFWGTFVALMVATSERTRREIKEFVDRHFYRYVHDYRREWAEFSRRISSIIGLEETLDVVMDFACEAVGAEKAVLLLEESGRFRSVRTKGVPECEVSVEGSSSFVEALRAGDVMRASDLPVEDLEDGEVLSELEVFVPLSTKEGLIGILALGKKASGRKYYGDDFVFLRTFSHQAAVAINNARLAERLAVSKGLESLYKLSSFVVHDLKSSVSMLSMLVENARENFSDPQFQMDALATISDTVAKMKRLMYRISGMSKGPTVGTCDINEAVKAVVERTVPSSSNGVWIKVELGKVPPVSVAREQVETVVQNILSNALDAVGREGSIEIRTFEDGNFVSLTISDDGSGMSKEFMEKRLFKPFQTTKEGGLGIGLYQVKEIVDSHGGKVDVESAEGRGTTFTVKLPKADGQDTRG